MTKLMVHRRKSVGAVLDGVEAGGFPGLVSAVGRMIGEDQPPIECFRQAEVDFGGAQTGEQVWDAMLDLVDCLRDAKLDPEVEVPDPPEEPPPDPTQPDRAHDLADIVLAALLVHLRGEGATGRPVQQYRPESERV